MRLLVGLVLLSCVGWGQMYDAYGGLTLQPCPTGAKDMWYVEKVGLGTSTPNTGNYWRWCTPAGNAFVWRGIWSVIPPTSGRSFILAGGSLGTLASSWYPYFIRNLSKYGFYGFDQYSSRTASPTANSQIQLGYKTAWPVIMGEVLRPSRYGIINNRTLAAQPLKDWDTTVSWDNGNSLTIMTRTDSMRFQDVFSTEYAAYLLAMMNDTGDNHTAHVWTASTDKQKYVAAWRVDDTDWMAGAGAGAQFQTLDSGSPINGRRHAHTGIAAWYAAPSMGVQSRSPATGSGILYADPANAANNIMCLGPEEAGPYGDSNFPISTVVNTPRPSDRVCTKYAFVELLRLRYNNDINQLNTAFGSSYTTFGTSGTAVSNQLVATGDGATSTFSFTIPSISVSNQIEPFSVRGYVGGVYRFADARHLSSQMACRNSSASVKEWGQIWGEIMAGTTTSSCSNPATTVLSTINYQTGAVVLKFDSAVANGAEIRISYALNGWGVGTGLLDESGHNAWTFDWVNNDHIMSGYDADIVAALDEFSYRYWYRYMKDVRNTLDSKYTGCNRSVNNGKGICPLYMSVSYLGTWGAPPYKEVLKAARTWVDVFPWYTYPNDRADFSTVMAYMDTHLGDKPWMAWEAFTGGDDSEIPAQNTAQVRTRYHTQEERGQQYYDAMNAMLTYQNSFGSYPGTGINFWRDFSSSGEGTAWGILTINGDPNDGYCPGPGSSRYNVVPGGTPVISVAVSGGVGTVTTRTGPTGNFHSVSPGVKIKFKGATGDTDLNGLFEVTAIASNTYTLSGMSAVTNCTYGSGQSCNEPALEVEYALYPCGGSGDIGDGQAYVSLQSGNRYRSSDSRLVTDKDGPFNNRFGDFLTKVTEANMLWVDMVPKDRVTVE